MTMTDQPAPAPEAEQPEVLPAPVQPGTHVEPHVRSAIDAAVEGALAMPGVPGRDEFLSLAAQARMLSLSGGAPKLIREDPYLAFHVVLIGRDLGISPSAAIELIDVIPGSGQQGPRLSLSPQLLNGQIRRLGLGSIVPVVKTEERCIAVALEPGGSVDWRCKRTWPEHLDDCRCSGIMGESEFTWDDARMANIVGRSCEPGTHSKPKAGHGQDGCGCNQGYRTYPKRMLWWRASGFAADDFFPEAGLGLYTAEELGAIVDAEGRPVDVTNVELPPGYEVAPPPEVEMATLEERWALQERIHALPEDAKLSLRQRWEERIQGPNGRPVPAWALSAAQHNLANALLRGAEAAAKAMKLEPRWEPEAALEATRRQLAQAITGPGWRPGAEAPPEPPSGTESDGEAPAGGETPPAPAPAQQGQPQGGIVAPQPPDVDDLGTIDGATEADVDAAIAEVKGMTQIREVDKALTKHRLNTEGEANVRRQRLAAAIIRERVAARQP